MVVKSDHTLLDTYTATQALDFCCEGTLIYNQR